MNKELYLMTIFVNINSETKKKQMVFELVKEDKEKNDGEGTVIDKCAYVLRDQKMDYVPTFELIGTIKDFCGRNDVKIITLLEYKRMWSFLVESN